MPSSVAGFLSLAGRILLCGLFLMAASHDVSSFRDITGLMADKGVPAPNLLLPGAILFLFLGSASVILGFWARWGACLLLIFLVLATYYFHSFWNLPLETPEDLVARSAEFMNFMKNVPLMGAMLMIIANGTGRWSLDNPDTEHSAPSADPSL